MNNNNQYKKQNSLKENTNIKEKIEKIVPQLEVFELKLEYEDNDSSRANSGNRGNTVQDNPANKSNRINTEKSEKSEISEKSETSNTYSNGNGNFKMTEKQSSDKLNNSIEELEKGITSIGQEQKTRTGSVIGNNNNSPKKEIIQDNNGLNELENNFSNTEDILDFNEYNKECLIKLKSITHVPIPKMKNQFIKYKLDKSKCIYKYNIYYIYYF